ncbi:MAG: hypothetical protein ACKOFO_07600, partial [Gemmatimonadota bacterium]
RRGRFLRRRGQPKDGLEPEDEVGAERGTRRLDVEPGDLIRRVLDQSNHKAILQRISDFYNSAPNNQKNSR